MAADPPTGKSSARRPQMFPALTVERLRGSLSLDAQDFVRTDGDLTPELLAAA